MTRNAISPRTWIAPAILALALLGPSGCTVDSVNPLAGLAETIPIPDAWIGTWSVDSLLGETPGVATTLAIEANADGSAQLTLKAGERATLQSASLATVGGTTIASVLGDDGAWTLIKIEVAGTQMSVRALDAAVVAADIQSGAIAGEVRPVGSGDTGVALTATGAALRTYLAARPTAFGAVAVNLTKLPEAP